MLLTPWIGLLVVIALAVWIRRGDSSYSEPDRAMRVIGVFMFLMCCVLGVAAGVGVSALSGSLLPREIEQQPSHVAQLAAARTVDSVKGHISGGIFVVRGEIGGQTYLRYYERSGEAVTPRQLVAGEGVYLYEQDVAPRIEVFDWHFKQAWWRWFAIDPGGKTYRLYVPVGSVSDTFEVKP